MRIPVLIAVAVALASPQPRDAARAHAPPPARDYDAARPSLLAAALARDQFHAVMRLDPADATAALEYAFLCFETQQQAEARRVFDRLRRAGNATAEQAFHNIDDPLAAGIARWQRAIELGADHFSDHFELATRSEEQTSE